MAGAGGLRRGHAAPAAAQRPRLPPARPRAADPWPYRSRARRRGLLATLALWRRTAVLEIWAGGNALALCRRLVDTVVWPGGPPIPVAYRRLAGGPILEDGPWRVGAFPVTHSDPDSFGFLFEKRPHRPLLPERLAALGVPDGALRGRLAAGEAVTLPDGRRIDPAAVLGPPVGGSRVAIVGDAGRTDDLLDQVRGVDLLVIEGTFLSADCDKARARSHLTAAEAAGLAAEAGVGRLYLTHLSSRYAPEAVLAEARAVFPAAELAADLAGVTVDPADRAHRPPPP